MSEPRALRPYQADAVAAVERDWTDGKSRVGVVLPTSTGKSTVIGKLVSNAYHRGERSLMFAHRGELIDQMIRDLRAVDPTIPVSDIGVVRAERDDNSAPIVGATLQTLATSRRREALGLRDLLCWDEVHHAGAAGFHTTLTELGGYDGARMAGFTATMYRQRGRIGLGDVIEKISYERDLRWAIRNGWAVQPHGLTVRVEALNKLDSVRSVAGDFHQSELAEVMEAATGYVVDAVLTHAADRRPIVFAASVAAAEDIAAALTAAGYPAAEVTGKLSYDQRQPIYDAYRAGTIRALVTVMVLTEGADFPMCDAVVLARPTRSRNLYSQMIGRALRLYQDKTDALVLDLSGSSRQMRLVNLPQLDADAPTAEVMPDGSIIEADPDEQPPEKKKQQREGPVDMVTIDLLAGSDTLWLETRAGVPFINLMANNEVVFVFPEGGRRNGDRTRWTVGQMNTRTRHGHWVSGSGRFQVPGADFVDLETALESAEVWIVESGQQIPRRAASWRRTQPPSEKQLHAAARMGIDRPEQMTRARLSDVMSEIFASRALDQMMVK
jgi:superfamily II DNA or RNA helicase